MSPWQRILGIVEDEAGAETRKRIESRILAEFKDDRVLIGSKRKVVDSEVLAKHNGNVKKTASELGISTASVYNVLRRRALIR